MEGSLFRVRNATHGDVAAIMEITREGFLKYREMVGVDTVDALSETAEDVIRDIDTKIVLVAMLDEEPVGTVRVEVMPNGTAVLTRFAVKVTNQNNGIGKSIMNLVDKLMIKRNVKRICLYTGSKLTSLIRFYYGRGFYIESTETSRGYIRAKLVKDYETGE